MGYGNLVTVEEILFYLGLNFWICTVFDDDENSNDEQNSIDFSKFSKFSGKSGEKLKYLESNFGGDLRFRMDEKFLDEFESENEEKNEENSTEKNEENEKIEEKRRNFAVLEKVLGHSLPNKEKFSNFQEKLKKSTKNLEKNLEKSEKVEENFENLKEKNEKFEKIEENFENLEEKNEKLKIDEKKFFEVKKNFAEELREKAKSSQNSTNFSILEAFGRKSNGIDAEESKQDYGNFCLDLFLGKRGQGRRGRNLQGSIWNLFRI